MSFEIFLSQDKSLEFEEMRSKMGWLPILLVLSLSFCDVLEARHEKKLPTAVVAGTVFCFQEKFSKFSHSISGAIVAVECRNGRSKPSFREEVKTDEKGEFRVHLPVISVNKHVKKIEECYVQLIKSSEPYCAVAAAAAATSSSLQLKSRKQGTHTFSASSKPSDDAESVLPSLEYPSLPAPIENPAVPNIPRIYDNLPPLPLLPGLPPLPQLPPLPPLPGFPRYPPKETAEKEPTPASKTIQKPNQNAVFQPEAFIPPIIPKKPWKPHFFLPPHKPLPHPFIPKIPLLPPPSSSFIPSPPPPPAGSSAPSPPPPTFSFFDFPPSVPRNSHGMPSTTKQTSP